MANPVQLKNTQNEVVSVPAERAQELLSSGYSVPNEQEVKEANLQDEYGGLGNQALTGLSSAASAATFGGTDQALTKSGLVNPETLQNLREANPISSGVGTAAGIVGSLAVPVLGEAAAAAREAQVALKAAKATGDAVKIAEATEAANAAANAAKGLTAADALNPVQAVSKIGAGIAERVAPAASGIARTALGVGLGSAAEGVAYGLGQSVSDQALGDPDAMGEKLAHNVGMGAVLGFGLGAATGGIGATYRRLFGKEAVDVATDLGAQTTPPETTPFGDVTETAQKVSTPSAILDDAEAAAKYNTPQEISEQAAKNLRPDAARTEEVAKAFGFEAQPGMLTSDKDVIYKEGTLLKSPSAAGDAYRAAYQDGYQKMTSGVEDIVKPSEAVGTPIEQTQAIRDGMVQKIEEAAGPHKELYDAIAPIRKEIDVSKSVLSELQDRISQLKQDGGLGPDQAKWVSEIRDAVGSLDNVDKLENYRSAIGSEATGARSHLASAAHDIKDLIEEAQLKSVEAYNREVQSPEIEGFVNKIKAARAAYKAYIDKFKPVSEALFNTDKIGGPRSFVEKIKDHLTDEQFMGKLFDKKNHKALSTLRENFPEQFEQIKNLEKSRITSLARGGEGKDFNALAATKQILGDGRASGSKGMSQEIRNQLFTPQEVERLKLAQHGLNRMSEVTGFNPTNSATGVIYANHLGTLRTAIGKAASGDFLGAASSLAAKPFQEMQDANLASSLKEQVGKQGAAKVNVLARLEKMAQATTAKIKSGAQDLFDFTSKIPVGAVGAVHIPTDEEHKDAVDKVSEYSNNPEKLINDMSNRTAILNAYAPNIASSMSKTAANSAKLLASVAPRPPNLGPLGPKLKPSISEKAIFNNYVVGTKDPFHAMNKLKEGTIVPADIQTLQAVYPKMYQEQQKAILAEMIDHVDKNGVGNIPNSIKVGLSLFLGQDMDQSISPQAIYANQMILGSKKAPDEDSMQAQPAARPSQKGLSALNKSQSLLTNQQETAQRGAES